MSNLIITTKNFESGFKKHCIDPTVKLRDVKQDFYLFAMDQAGKQNFTQVNFVANNLPSGDDKRAVNSYFSDHCQVKWDNKEKKYLNVQKKAFKYLVPESKWYDYKATPMTTDFDLGAVILNALKTTKSVQAPTSKRKVAKGKVNETKALFAYLSKAPGLDAGKLKSILAA